MRYWSDVFVLGGIIIWVISIIILGLWHGWLCGCIALLGPACILFSFYSEEWGFGDKPLPDFTRMFRKQKR